MIMHRNQTGFTMIELLMAMAVFSFMMLIVTTGFIQVVRIHQAGISSRATQQNARIVMDGVSKDIRESGAATVGNGGAAKTWLCLSRGSTTLEYAVDGSGNLRAGSVSNPPAGTCPSPAITSSWRTLNDSSTQVTQFAASATTPVSPGLGTVLLTLTIVSRNDTSDLDATQTHCQPGAGSQFCAVTTLVSTASLRGGDGL